MAKDTEANAVLIESLERQVNAARDKGIRISADAQTQRIPIHYPTGIPGRAGRYMVVAALQSKYGSSAADIAKALLAADKAGVIALDCSGVQKAESDLTGLVACVIENRVSQANRKLPAPYTAAQVYIRHPQVRAGNGGAGLEVPDDLI